jgi:hypothetical protein
MKKIVLWFLPLVGLTAGFVSGRLVRPAPEAAVAPLSASASETGALEKTRAAAEEARRTERYSPENVAAILELPSTLHRTAAFKAFLDRLSAGQFPNVLRDLHRQGLQEDVDIMTIFFRCWADGDPERALHEALKLSPPAEKMSYQGNLRSKVVSAVMRAWARKDLAGARAAAAKLTGLERMMAESYMRNVGGAAGSGNVDPLAGKSFKERLWKDIQVDGDSWSMGGRAGETMRKWAQEDPAGAAEEILRSKILQKTHFVEVLNTEWRAKDPAAFEAFLNKLPAEAQADVRGRLVRSEISQLLSRNLAHARDYIEKLPPGESRRYGLDQLADRMFNQDREGAIALVTSFSEQDRNVLPGNFFEKWFAVEPERAAAALLEFPGYAKRATETPDREHFNDMNRMMKPWAEKDPAAAGVFAAQLAKKDRAEAMYGIAQVWCARDAAAANAWAASLPAGPGQDEALRQFGFIWAKSDANLVTKHLDRLPSGSGKSAAAEGFAFAVFDTDPDAALEWTRVIHTPEMRFDVLKRSWSNWRYNNHAAATDWLRNNRTIKPEERAAIEKTDEE